jgi:hypothetical protein
VRCESDPLTQTHPRSCLPFRGSVLVPESGGVVRRDGAGVPAATLRVRTFPVGLHRKVTAMNRFVAPLSFTIAAAWVVILFVLVHSAP